MALTVNSQSVHEQETLDRWLEERLRLERLAALRASSSRFVRLSVLARAFIRRARDRGLASAMSAAIARVRAVLGGSR